MSNQLKMTREQVIECLNGRLPWARAYDRDRLAEHKKSEKVWRDTIVERAKAVSKLSYDEMRESACNYRDDRLHLERGLDAPSCPKSYVQDITRTLADLELTKQQEFTISSDYRQWPNLYHLLTFDPDAKSMCA